MKKVAFLLIVLGIALVALGVGVRIAVDTNADVKEANEMLKMFVGAEISPEIVRSVLEGELTVMGSRLSADDILDMLDVESADVTKIMLFLHAYAYSTMIAIAGGVMAVVGIILPKKKY